jgi:hypothetical protein
VHYDLRVFTNCSNDLQAQVTVADWTRSYSGVVPFELDKHFVDDAVFTPPAGAETATSEDEPGALKLIAEVHGTCYGGQPHERELTRWVRPPEPGTQPSNQTPGSGAGAGQTPPSSGQTPAGGSAAPVVCPPPSGRTRARQRADGCGTEFDPQTPAERMARAAEYRRRAAAARRAATGQGVVETIHFAGAAAVLAGTACLILEPCGGIVLTVGGAIAVGVTGGAVTGWTASTAINMDTERRALEHYATSMDYYAYVCDAGPRTVCQPPNDNDPRLEQIGLKRPQRAVATAAAARAESLRSALSRLRRSGAGATRALTAFSNAFYDGKTGGATTSAATRGARAAAAVAALNARIADRARLRRALARTVLARVRLRASPRALRLGKGQRRALARAGLRPATIDLMAKSLAKPPRSTGRPTLADVMAGPNLDALDRQIIAVVSGAAR